MSKIIRLIFFYFLTNFNLASLSTSFFFSCYLIFNIWVKLMCRDQLRRTNLGPTSCCIEPVAMVTFNHIWVMHWPPQVKFYSKFGLQIIFELLLLRNF